LKGSKRETIEKIPNPLRHRTYSSKRQPEFGKTRAKGRSLCPEQYTLRVNCVA
jgi:hypothetical protein